MPQYDRAAQELLRLLPRVLRARDFHLYLEGGKRLTDLWRAGGKAVLGHKPPLVLRELKNAAERGLYSSLPHPTERRLLKALEELFPGRAFRLYPDKSILYRALEEAGFIGPFQDPALPPAAGVHSSEMPSVSLWRPFVETAPGAVFIPVLPWPLGPEVLVLNKSVDASFPPGELIPPVLLAPAARALYDLAAALKEYASNPPRYPKIENALKESSWQRRGIYLSVQTDMDKEKYAALFRRFLEGGFLIPPSQREPLILPLSMPPGEESKLAGLLGP